MARRILLSVGLLAFVLNFGCGAKDDPKQSNPNNLEYGTEGPPKRDGVKGDVKKK